MAAVVFTVAAIATAAFGGPTWAWALLAALAALELFHQDSTKER